MAMRRGMVDSVHPVVDEGIQTRAEYSAFLLRPAAGLGIAMFLPQFFGSFPSSSPGAALFRVFNTGQDPKRGLHKEIEMDASSGSSRVRPIVVDFLATLFVTFRSEERRVGNERRGQNEEHEVST